MFLLPRFGMIDNPCRFKEDAGTVIWLFDDLEYVGFKKIGRNVSVLRRHSCL